jgi:hypothetical protein
MGMVCRLYKAFNGSHYIHIHTSIPHLLVLRLDQVADEDGGVGGEQQRAAHASAEDEQDLGQLVAWAGGTLDVARRDVSKEGDVEGSWRRGCWWKGCRRKLKKEVFKEGVEGWGCWRLGVFKERKSIERK